MTSRLISQPLTPELKKHIDEGFRQYAIQCTGINGRAHEPISFELYDQDNLIGCVVVELFWGQLHIKYLIVEPNYRGLGWGRKLMEYALNFGQEHGCDFAFVETMSFQAPRFYQNLGFEVELKRDGYARDVSFYYLRKDLNKVG